MVVKCVPVVLLYAAFCTSSLVAIGPGLGSQLAALFKQDIDRLAATYPSVQSTGSSKQAVGGVTKLASRFIHIHACVQVVCQRELCLLSAQSGRRQQHLDLLDSDVQDSRMTSSTACPTKIDIFVMSTGIDDNNVFKDASIVIEQDCVVADGPWTPIRDVDGSGTTIAGGIAWPYGVSRNTIIHSIKAGEGVLTATTESVLCALGRVRSWLVDHPCRKAIVVFGVLFNLSPGVPIDPQEPVTVAVRKLIEDFGDRIVVISLPAEIMSIYIPGVPFPVFTVYAAPGNVPEVLAVSMDFLNAADPDFLTVATGPSTDLFVQVGSAVLTPFPVNVVVLHSLQRSYGAGVGLIAGVLADYWLSHARLTGNELREMIELNGESDIHVTGGVTGGVLPPGVVNKRLKYRCTTGCEPCKNGGILIDDALVLKPGRALCACPPETTGATCETREKGEME